MPLPSLGAMTRPAITASAAPLAVLLPSSAARMAAPVLALPLFHWLAPQVDAWTFLVIVVALFWLGVWASSVTGNALGVADHGGMVWDETVAFMLVLFFVPVTGYWQAFAFLIFRLFDIVKPPPIRYYDRMLKNGFGAMWDDLLAAGYTLLIIAVAYAVLG